MSRNLKLPFENQSFTIISGIQVLKLSCDLSSEISPMLSETNFTVLNSSDIKCLQILICTSDCYESSNFSSEI